MLGPTTVLLFGRWTGEWALVLLHDLTPSTGTSEKSDVEDRFFGRKGLSDKDHPVGKSLDNGAGTVLGRAQQR